MKIFFTLLSFLVLSNLSYSQVTFTDVASSMGVADPGNGQGTVFFDYNNDGFLDIYLVNNGSSNRLYRNTSGTSFTEVGASLGVANNGAGRGCAVADFNSDGYLDIVVGNFSQLIILYKNDVTSFSNFTPIAGMNLLSYGGSINWFDYNKDGRIDCYVGNNGIPPRYNYFFRNDNLLTFSQIAFSIGFIDSTSTLSTACADYDNDGDVDLFTGSQTLLNGKTSFLYRNDSVSFTDVTVASGVMATNFTWGADWGDYDNDGDLDLFLANSNGPDNLFKNNGDGTFTDVATALGVADPSQGFTCGWADYDNDGWLDLFIGNGTGTDKLYKNNGTTFTDVAASVGINDMLLSNSSSWGDFNNDGYLDLYCSNNGVPNQLYRSSGGTNRWLIVKLIGTQLKNAPVGARVTLKAGGNSYIREVQGGSGHNGQNSLPLEFGLGSQMTIDSLIVRWPDGDIGRLSNISTNQILSITEVITNITQNQNAIPEKFSLSQNYPNPFNPKTIINYTIGAGELGLPDGKAGITNYISLKVYDALGKEVATLVSEEQNAGSYSVEFDARLHGQGSDFSSGIYFYSLNANSYRETKSMILIK